MTEDEAIYEVDGGESALKEGTIQRFVDGLDFKGFDTKGFFDGPVTPENAKSAVSKIRALEEMLKAADKFAENAMRFCLAEAQVYVEIAAHEGAEEQLTEAKQRLVRWIRAKSSEQMAAILEEVATGVRITVIERRESKTEGHRYDPIEDLESMQKRFIAEGVRTGKSCVTRARFYEESENPARLPRSAVDAFTERTRDGLIKKGLRGIGDGKGTYILPSKCERSKVADMVKTKLQSIETDLKSLKDICNETKFVVPHVGVLRLHKLIDSLESEVEFIDFGSNA